MAEEATALTPESYAKLNSTYDQIISEHENIYGAEHVHRVFHLRYHTANKVSSILGRLRRFTFCVYESDLLFLSYMLEEPKNMLANNLHYELIHRSDPLLVTSIPFEPGKSFPEMGNTSEVTEFEGIKRVGGHRIFIKMNYDNILSHIRCNLHRLPFLRAEYLNEIENIDRDNITTLVINKLYGILGALEFKGYPLPNPVEIDDGTEGFSDVYNEDFFQQMYLDGALHTSGLAGMVFERKGTYRSFPKLGEDERLLVSIMSTPGEEKQRSEVTKQVDGYTVRFEVAYDSRYRIVHFAYNNKTKKRRELYRRRFVCQSLELAAEGGTEASNDEARSVVISAA